MPGKYEIRSYDVQEILGQVPGWITRWGNTILLFSAGMLLLWAMRFTYPEERDGTIRVKYTDAPEIIGSFPEHLFTELKPGMEVKIRLAAFPESKYGELKGIIDSVDKKITGGICTAHIRGGNIHPYFRQINPAAGTELQGACVVTVRKRSLWSKIINQ
jgi:hypothetical protein